MTPPHVGVGLALGRLITEIPPPIDHLLGRASADAELQTSAGDEIGSTGVLGHVERVLVAHVDDRRADLDAAGLRADGRQQRKRRSELASEVMDPEIGAVRAQLLGGDGQVDGLQERVRGRAGLRLRRGRPMPEGEESDFLHASNLLMRVAVCDPRCAGWWKAFCGAVRGRHHCSSLTFGDGNVEPVEGCRNEAVQTNKIDELVGAVLAEGADREAIKRFGQCATPHKFVGHIEGHVLFL